MPARAIQHVDLAVWGRRAFARAISRMTSPACGARTAICLIWRRSIGGSLRECRGRGSASVAQSGGSEAEFSPLQRAERPTGPGRFLGAHELRDKKNQAPSRSVETRDEHRAML